MAKEKAPSVAQALETARTSAPPAAYETVDPEDAAHWQAVGGHLVSVVRLFPDKVDADGDVQRSFRPGKRYRFAETQAQLDALATQAAQEERG